MGEDPSAPDCEALLFPSAARPQRSEALERWLRFMLASPVPTSLYWGSERRYYYNDAMIPLIGGRHPDAMGRPAGAVWPETRDFLLPMLDEVWRGGRGRLAEDERHLLVRDGLGEETWWSYSTVPVLDAASEGGALLMTSRDTTDEVLRRRYATLLGEIEDRLRGSGTVDEILDGALTLLGRALDALRAGYIDVDLAGGTFTKRRAWTKDGAPPFPQDTLPLGTFGAALTKELRAGRTVVVEDNERDLRIEPEGRAQSQALGARAGIVVPILVGSYVGTVFVQADRPRRWRRADIEIIEQVTLLVAQAVARRRAQVAATRSEQRARLLFEQGEDLMFTVGVDRRLADINASAARALGYRVEELIGRDVAELVPPDDQEAARVRADDRLNIPGTVSSVRRVLDREGREQLWELNSVLAHDERGRPSLVHYIGRDVTERRRFEERRELLIRELNHRVKNTLALVQSLALQTLGRGPAGEEFTGRLLALAAAHDLLTQEQWEGVPLAALLRATTGATAGERVAVSGPALEVSPKAAIALSMAAHELATNAIKYGALSGPEGRVALSWMAADGRLRLEWREEGGPAVAPPTRRGFGLRMIERVLASDLQAQVTVQFNPLGLVCVVDAALAAVGAGA